MRVGGGVTGGEAAGDFGRTLRFCALQHDIRIAGVKVGVVKDVEIFDRDKALVTFSVKDDAPITESTTASAVTKEGSEKR